MNVKKGVQFATTSKNVQNEKKKLKISIFWKIAEITASCGKNGTYCFVFFMFKQAGSFEHSSHSARHVFGVICRCVNSVFASDNLQKHLQPGMAMGSI